MKKCLLLLISIFAVHVSVAQNQPNNWYFGVLAGMTFNGGTPTALYGGAINTNEGCGAISDTAGNLLFYTDGITVWNSLHQVMPNGTGLLGGISSTQSALVVPAPGNDSLYYIFTVDEIGGPNGFCYSIVNMNLDSGRGDVTVKNSLMLNNVTEKLAGVFHLNNHDVWIMVHEWGSNGFFAYLLTDSGITNVNPVVSNVGAVHNTSVIQNTYGQMKFNSCGSKVAAAISYQDEVEIFDFDNQTGIVSNPVNIAFADHVYGVEFSSDNSKFYVTCYDPSATLMQYDMSATNIPATGVVISTTTDLYGMQLAPDDKIYVAHSFNQYLAAIDSPSLAGTLCNYTDFGFDLDPNFNGVTGSLGLPGFVQSYFHPDFPNVVCNFPVASWQSSDTTLCEKNCVDFTDLTAGPVNSWQWLFPGAVPASDTVQNPVNICYNNYGSYDVTLIITNNAGTDTLTMPGFINVLQSPATPTISVIGGDTLISSTGVNYQWYFGGNPIPGATQQLLIALQPGIYYVVITDSNNCPASSAAVVVTSTDELSAGKCVSIETHPGMNAIRIKITGCPEKQISLRLVNMLGQEVYSSGKLSPDNGSVNEVIPVQSGKGMYMLSVYGERFIQTRKVMME